MSTIPDWPKLWAKEPALKPDGLEYVRKGGSVFVPRYGTSEPVDEDTYATADGQIDDAMSAALNRDAAVLWLDSGSRKFRGWGCRFVGAAFGGNNVPEYSCQWTSRGKVCSTVPHDQNVITGTEGWFPSRDAALFAACNVEIESRERTNANP